MTCYCALFCKKLVYVRGDACRFWGCDRGKWACKKVAGTLFGTVGVVELSYRKFGEFVVEWIGTRKKEYVRHRLI